MLRPHGAAGLDALFCCALPDRGGGLGRTVLLRPARPGRTLRLDDPVKPVCLARGWFILKGLAVCFAAPARGGGLGRTVLLRPARPGRALRLDDPVKPVCLVRGWFILKGLAVRFAAPRMTAGLAARPAGGCLRMLWDAPKGVCPCFEKNMKNRQISFAF